MPVLGHGSNGRYSDVLTACIDGVRAAAANEIPPEKGSRARLPDAIVEKLEKIVRRVQGSSEPGGDPTAALPRGLLKTLMEFLDPFCSPVTLQKRMALMSEAYMKGPGGKGSDKPALAAGARVPDDEEDGGDSGKAAEPSEPRATAARLRERMCEKNMNIARDDGERSCTLTTWA